MAKEKIELSVVVVNMNTKDLTLECVESIRKEDSDLSWEIIMVDNGSTDGSVEAFKKLEKEMDNFTFIGNDKNEGYGKANNQGIRVAQADYVILLNNDTVVKKNALKKLYDFAKKKKDAGVVAPRLLNADGSIQASCFYFPTIVNAIREYWLGEEGLFEKYAPKGKKTVTVDAVVGAAFLMTPEALERVGMLDEKYFAYFEDIDYCREVWRNNLKVYYYPKVEIIHYHGSTFRKLAKKEDQWKKLVPSSKLYHGTLKHFILTFVLKVGQKWQSLTKQK